MIARALLLAALLVPVATAAQSVKLGVITDMSGSLSAMSGQGSVVTAQLAVEDCLAHECKGMTIEILTADHLNKPDLAVAIVRKWIDVDGVNAVTDMIQAGVQVALKHVLAEKNHMALFPGGTARLANEDCAPATSVVWMWDTYGQAIGVAKPLTKPGSKWFFITADYVFGIGLQSEATGIINAGGGTVIGGVRHPFNFPGDFSPFLLQGQASGADVIALGNTGTDLITTLKQAREFGIGRSGSQKLVSFVLTLPDVAALSLETAQGVTVAESFYWNFDPETRAWSQRFFARYQKAMPSTIQAGVYSVTLHYLRAVAAARTTETAAVMRQMHTLPVGDATIHSGTLRADGRMVHDTYLFRVKSPAESKEPFDFYERIATIPAAEAFRPLSESVCKAIK